MLRSWRKNDAAGWDGCIDQGEPFTDKGGTNPCPRPPGREAALKNTRKKNPLH
ncbi:hypothetical protein DVDV_3356 [Desulfovibrio sp. DV]|nr:hypothetical protein DVDV_3356 [Desulfovibrio sp. DV]